MKNITKIVLTGGHVLGNAARIENVEQAVELDNKLTKAWKIHSNFRVIESSVGFDKKMHRLINDISTFIEEAKDA